ncbi:MAG: WYL domain-containing protein [Ruminococcaceae bacterium]|nr:WYL domain-containing protein [Oscillospiraceae bacterium]
MPKKENQKLKLMYLAQIFTSRSDEEHPLTMQDIISALEGYGISAERKSLYSDMELLRDFGYDIVSKKTGRGCDYFLASRDFELPELKLLVDAVQSSKFITQKKSEKLIKKLDALTSIHQAKELRRNVVVSGRIKAMNESIYYNVDKLHYAILRDKRISFKYFEWTADKEKNYRHNGKRYDVSPWHLMWDDENYYLVAYDTESNMIRHYRVDKMEDIRLSEDIRLGKEHFKDFSAAEYSAKHFGMFGGDETLVRLRVKNTLAGVIIDRFGKEPSFFKNGDGSFELSVRVNLSPQFYGWIMSFGGDISVLSPDTAVTELKAMAERILEQ